MAKKKETVVHPNSNRRLITWRPKEANKITLIIQEQRAKNKEWAEWCHGGCARLGEKTRQDLAA
jgi:hypothetical protein